MPTRRSATHHRRFTDGFGQATVLIGADVRIRGALIGGTNVDFGGTLDGDLVADGLVILRPEGRITGRIEADAVLVEGRVDGEIRASARVELGPSCRVDGDVTAGSVAIADGATFDGTVAMTGSATSRGPVRFVDKRTERP